MEDQLLMQLKKLIVQGFKSFADRTEFVFASPITGIVGPNGCGKSNVVDAFKWVLGEQSAKSLRGDAMMDVIFNGSGGRKPAGMAEVVLVFSNPRREDNTRHLNIDADEVSVGRRLYRDGASEYQLNNQAARLKDVRELFLDTGVGVDAYSVIEQGRVAALLESNPQERRLIFEEAAGISKFKARKKEAQRKLERVDQNLLRLRDIVDEVEKRVRGVRIQAGRARTFQEHSKRLSELRLTYAIQEYHTHVLQLDQFQKQCDDTRFRLDDVAGDLVGGQDELSARRQDQQALSQQRQRCEHELVQVQSAVQAARQRQQYAQRQLAQIAEQLAAFDRDRVELEEKAARTAVSLEQESAELSRLAGQVKEQTELIDARQAAYRDGQLQAGELDRELERHKAQALDVMRRLAANGSELGAIEIERKNLNAQSQRQEQRRGIVLGEIGQLEAVRGQLLAGLEAAQNDVAARQTQLEALRQEAQQLGKLIAGIAEQLSSAREHRCGLLSRQKLLADLEARREGVSEGVKNILRQRDKDFSFIDGLVADVLRVDVEHAHVIEAALDGRDQWLITASGSAAQAARQAMEDLEGRVNILCVDELAQVPSGGQACDYDWNRHPHRIRLAVDLVRFAPEHAPVAAHLLGRTIVVDTLDAAADLHRSGPAGYRYVTPVGEVLEADGTLRAGPLTAAMGLLSRRSELDALILQIAEIDSRIADLAGKLTAGNTQARSLEESQNSLRTAIYAASTEKVKLSSSLAQNGDRQSALRREQPVLERELQGLGEQVAVLDSRAATLAAGRQELETKAAFLQQQVEATAVRQRQTTENLALWGEELTALRVEFGQVQEKKLACQQQTQRLTSLAGEIAQQVQRVAASVQGLEYNRGGVEAELAEAQAAEVRDQVHQEELAGKVKELEVQVGRIDHAVQDISARVETLRLEHSRLETALHAVELEAVQQRVRIEGLVARTLEELQLDLPARYAEFSAPQADGAPGAGYQPQETDWDAVAAEIKALRDKIHRLGNVNLDAISELDELETREKFLSTQVADLTSSKQQLEELIETINVESSARFEAAFNSVREHFQGMFRKLFGGGKADVFLQTEIEEDSAAMPTVGPDGQTILPVRRKIDVLDAGIEIIAHPPGKKPVSISQLSGGEKTMTCVALLMSIFKSKPSPFCILDEVDAALDEANNQRFNLIVQEFLQQSQFIIITHSKRTMQIADVLYGVTMQEQGVSKRVAVKFDQVDAEGRVSAAAAAQTLEQEPLVDEEPVPVKPAAA